MTKESDRIGVHTQADYLMMVLIPDGPLASTDPDYFMTLPSIFLSQWEDGSTVVLVCRKRPDYTLVDESGYEHMEATEAVRWAAREAYDNGLVNQMPANWVRRNGLGNLVKPSEPSYIRIVGPDGTHLPYVFRDYADAREFMEKRKAGI